MIYNVGSLIETQRVRQAWKIKEGLYYALKENNRADFIDKGVREENIKE